MKAVKRSENGWRVQVSKTVNGKKIRASITRRTKEDALADAAAWLRDAKADEICPDMTVKAALERYIDSRRDVRSPSTIRGYTNILHALQKDPLAEIRLDKLTQADVSRAVQRWTRAGAAPKTVRNRHGLLTAILKEYRPQLVLRTALPEKTPPTIVVPTDEDIQDLLDRAKDTPIEIAILLGAFVGMRRGEIAALQAEDIEGTTIRIHRTVAIDENGELHTKAPKTYAGTRRAPAPPDVIAKLPTKGPVCPMTPMYITTRFCELMADRKKDGLPTFRFHDLRHFCTSKLHASGVPDAYLMRWMGWGSDQVLKTIYRHTMQDAEERFADVAADVFSGILRGDKTTA